MRPNSNLGPRWFQRCLIFALLAARLFQKHVMFKCPHIIHRDIRLEYFEYQLYLDYQVHLYISVISYYSIYVYLRFLNLLTVSLRVQIPPYI